MNSPAAIASGIVPGFPLGMPPALQDAWLALAQRPEKVAIEIPGDRHIRFTIKSDPKAAWKVLIFITLMGIASMIGAWLFDRYQSSPSFDLAVRLNPIKLYLVASMCLLGGVMGLLIQIASGGVARNTIVEASLDRLKIDRWVSGDHVVREYSPSEVRRIWTDGAIEIDARLGTFSVANFAPDEVQDAVAEIVGTLFWGDDAFVDRNVSSPAAANGKMRVLVLPSDPNVG